MRVQILCSSAQAVHKQLLRVVVVFGLDALHEAVDKNVLHTQFRRTVPNHPDHGIGLCGSGLVVEPEPFCGPLSKVVVQTTQDRMAVIALVLWAKWVCLRKHSHHAAYGGDWLHFEAGHAYALFLTYQGKAYLRRYIGLSVPVLACPHGHFPGGIRNSLHFVHGKTPAFRSVWRAAYPLPVGQSHALGAPWSGGRSAPCGIEIDCVIQEFGHGRPPFSTPRTMT